MSRRRDCKSYPQLSVNNSCSHVDNSVGKSQVSLECKDGQAVDSADSMCEIDLH
jgi:hypothetical protein